MSYNTKVYHKLGGDELVVMPGGKITANEVQAAHIANPTDLATALTAIAALTAALEGVGITAAA